MQLFVSFPSSVEPGYDKGMMVAVVCSKTGHIPKLLCRSGNEASVNPTDNMAPCLLK